MKKNIKTYEQLKHLHNKQITCTIEGNFISDAKISIETNKNNDFNIFVCQNKFCGSEAKNKLGYKYSWIISENRYKYGSILDLSDDDEEGYLFDEDEDSEDFCSENRDKIIITYSCRNIMLMGEHQLELDFKG